MSLGILGGTFNPPHLGHLALARCALEQLGLGRVLLVPSCVPPHKQAEADPGPEHRLRMCELAVAGVPRLEACPLEVRRGGASYTVDTLLALRSLHPDATLTLILGSDVARTLSSWRRPDELMALAGIAVAAREGDDGPGDAAGGSGDAAEGPGDAAGGSGDAAEGPGDAADGSGDAAGGSGDAADGQEEAPGGLVAEAVQPELPAGAVSLDLPEVPVSSSLVRARVAAGESLDGFVSPTVAAYIAEHSLYAAAGVRAS